MSAVLDAITARLKPGRAPTLNPDDPDSITAAEEWEQRVRDMFAHAPSDQAALIAEVARLRAQVAALLPYAARSVDAETAEHVCHDDGCDSYLDALDMEDRIAAGDYGPPPPGWGNR